jgi:uncharacterized protein (TIRG00374 family)
VPGRALPTNTSHVAAAESRAAAWPSSRPASGMQWLLAGVGLALLVVLVHQVGPRRLIALLAGLGWWAPLLFVPYALGAVLDVEGWRVTFAGPRPPRWLLFRVRLSGETLNSVTPTAYLGGEPVKAYLLRRFGVPLGEGATSVILAKTALTIAQIAFVVIGAALFVLERGGAWSGASTLAAMTAGAVVVTALLVRWQRRAPVSLVARIGRRLFPRARALQNLEHRAGEIDERLRTFYGARWQAAVASVLLHLAGWFAGAAETYLVMPLIGLPITWSDAVVIEALAQPVRLVGLVVPGTLGVFEASGMVIFGLLGLTPELGLAMMLLKRLRELGYSLVGLGFLARLRPGPRG